MKIVIAGGTGFLGSPLAEVYAEEGHDVRVLTRKLAPGEARHEPGTGMPGVTRVGWKPDGSVDSAAHAALTALVEDADAVVNLAGESLADKRWTAQRKALLRDSRLHSTRTLAAAIAAAAKPPRVLISASGVGYYGASDEPKTEDSPPGTDFVAALCEDWEAEARRAAGAGTRVVLLRTGMVIERSGGALAKMIPVFRRICRRPHGLRPPIRLVDPSAGLSRDGPMAGRDPALEGPVNATAPHPVIQRAFARALGHGLRRPSLIPAPAFALRILLGEMADPIVLTGQRVIPARAQAHGYHFRYPEIDIAMRGIFQNEQ